MRIKNDILVTNIKKVSNDTSWLSLLKDIKRQWICEVEKTTFTPESLKNHVDKGNDGKPNGIIVEPDYQRKFRFSNAKASSIIESLLLKIPIPVIYLATENVYEEENDSYTPVRRVIDGQHRIKSICKFMNNEYKLTKLEVLKPLEGFYYKDFPTTLKAYFDSQTTLEISTIDVNENQHLELEVFSRFNEETNPLGKFELYNAIYLCEYVKRFKEESLKVLSENSRWKKMFNFSKASLENADYLGQLYLIPAYYRLDSIKSNDTPIFVRKYMQKVYELECEEALKQLEEDKQLMRDFLTFMCNLADANNITNPFSKEIVKVKENSKYKYLTSIMIQFIQIYRELRKIGLLDKITDYKELYRVILKGFETENGELFGDFGGISSTSYTYQNKYLTNVMETIGIFYSEEIQQIFKTDMELDKYNSEN
ncbi:DUF262 domain-containing protein [uncultured Clostridium sp.]|uniref:DUF262 domain-containing protein n=1 Tax=uncultured Clostridium sp. TaxID=59620 RepID=UPI0025F1BA5E|nr:DUF262 domain-containing protein [uncultured Clostridium sp.]